MSDFDVEEVEFPSHGNTLRGELFIPHGGRENALPAVVLAHGWGMTAGGNLRDYATVFAQAGMVAMTFDFRNLGKSDGNIRQDINPYEQVEDFRNALTYVEARDEVDEKRIGIWGSSYAGGHALVVAAVDSRVKCVVSQVPTIDGYRAAQLKFDDATRAAHEEKFAQERRAIMRGAAPALAQSVSAVPDEPVSYPGTDSYTYMMGDGERSATWRNESTVRSLELARTYIPGAYVERIAPTPLLMVIASADTTCPTSLQVGAFETAAEPKKLHLIEGGHYTPYVDQFPSSSSAACDWLKEYL